MFGSNFMACTLGDIAQALAEKPGGRLVGPADMRIERLAPLERAGTSELAFVAHARYASRITSSSAACLVVPPSLEAAAMARGACIVTDDPYLYFAYLTQWWRARHEVPQVSGVDASARVHPTAVLGQDVRIGPFAVVGEHVVLEDGVCLGAHGVLEAHVRIGAGSRLAPRVVVGQGCVIGARAVVHSGAVIGADGFGFAPGGGRWIKIEQLGAVRIGDDVEIGANTCIDRGALDDTVIGDGVKLDNLIQIGHNVTVGKHSAMAGCVGVAGSARIGAGCTIGGGAVVLGHLQLADGVHVSAASVVTRSLNKPGHYSGVFPLDDNASWEKNAASLRQLHRLRERLRRLEQALPPLSSNEPTP